MENRSNPLRVRLAKDRDIPRLLELLRQVNNVHQRLRPDLFLEDQTKYTEKDLEQLLRLHDAAVFVAADGQDRVRGYLICYIKQIRGSNLVSRKNMHIDDLCVDETERHSGVGRLLLEAAKAYAKEIGCTDITLNVWEGNADAMEFYANRGFAPKSHILEMKL